MTLKIASFSKKQNYESTDRCVNPSMKMRICLQLETLCNQSANIGVIILSFEISYLNILFKYSFEWLLSRSQFKCIEVMIQSILINLSDLNGFIESSFKCI